MIDLTYVILGGALGSGCRYLIGLLVPAASGLPWATVIVNLAGSLLLGYLVGRGHGTAGQGRAAMLLLGPGFCGGFTTYSTFAVETTMLLERHDFGGLFTYLTITVIGGIAMAFIGFLLARHTS